MCSKAWVTQPGTKKSTTPMRPVRVVVARVERGVPCNYGGRNTSVSAEVSPIEVKREGILPG